MVEESLVGGMAIVPGPLTPDHPGLGPEKEDLKEVLCGLMVLYQACLYHPVKT